MNWGSQATERRPRCGVCGKARHTTYTEARRAAVGLMRERPAARGVQAYWSKPCQTYHVGSNFDRRNEKMQRG